MNKMSLGWISKFEEHLRLLGVTTSQIKALSVIDGYELVAKEDLILYANEFQKTISNALGLVKRFQKTEPPALHAVARWISLELREFSEKKSDGETPTLLIDLHNKLSLALNAANSALDEARAYTDNFSTLDVFTVGQIDSALKRGFISDKGGPDIIPVDNFWYIFDPKSESVFLRYSNTYKFHPNPHRRQFSNFTDVCRLLLKPLTGETARPTDEVVNEYKAIVDRNRPMAIPLPPQQPAKEVKPDSQK